MRRTLGEQLRIARAGRGHTQEDAAETIGCDVTTIGRWERLRSVVTQRHHRALQKYLGCNAATLERLLRGQLGAVTNGRLRSPRGYAPRKQMSAAGELSALIELWNGPGMLRIRHWLATLAARGKLRTGPQLDELTAFFRILDSMLRRRELPRGLLAATFGSTVAFWARLLRPLCPGGQLAPLCRLERRLAGRVQTRPAGFLLEEEIAYTRAAMGGFSSGAWRRSPPRSSS